MNITQRNLLQGNKKKEVICLQKTGCPFSCFYILFVKHCSKDMFFGTSCPTLSQDSEKNSNTKLVTRKRNDYVPLKNFHG